jgi:glutamine amidotransferase
MIAIVKYNAGNATSVFNALSRLGCEALITDQPSEIRAAEKVIFPGVGEAGSAMRFLREKGLDRLLPALTQPVLGICLGMQLLCDFSEESATPGLGIFSARVRRFPPGDKVPHMGWNNLPERQGSLFEGIEASDDFYFVHSYYAEVCDQTTAVCEYIQPFSAALQRDNFFGVQFHPEKSGLVGEKLLKNFLNL